MAYTSASPTSRAAKGGHTAKEGTDNSDAEPSAKRPTGVVSEHIITQLRQLAHNSYQEVLQAAQDAQSRIGEMGEMIWGLVKDLEDAKELITELRSEVASKNRSGDRMGQEIKDKANEFAELTRRLAEAEFEAKKGGDARKKLVKLQSHLAELANVFGFKIMTEPNDDTQ